VNIQRVLVIFRHNLRLLMRDPGPIVVFILTPLLVMAIIKPTQELVLVSRNFPHTNGSEQVVPGFTIMFAFFWVIFIGRAFFAEHGWGTWERLQATQASAADIMMGKLLPAFVVIAVQMTVLFGVGTLVFDLSSKGPLPALAIVLVPLIGVVLALTLALVSMARTLTQIDAAANLLMMVFAALGGPLAAISALPEWAQTIAPATPSYWAMKASDDVILRGHGVSSVLLPAAVLVAYAALLVLVAVSRFSFSETKTIEA
jgi:ABC-2 type transport system permease protein